MGSVSDAFRFARLWYAEANSICAPEPAKWPSRRTATLGFPASRGPDARHWMRRTFIRKRPNEVPRNSKNFRQNARMTISTAVFSRFLKILRTSLLGFRRTSRNPRTVTLSALRKTATNTLTETTDLVHRHTGVSEKFSTFLRTSAGNSVRHEAVNAMLLNEFLKAHQRIEKEEATIAGLQKQIEALTASLQKVCVQLELNKSAPQTVLNNP